jgi:hypothetical protein
MAMTSGTPPLIGRHRELATAERALARCAGGSAVVLEIAGEPGIGKTRLLAEIGRLAGRRGYQVVGGRAGEYEQAVAFGVFADPLDEHLRGLAQPRRAAVLAGLAPALLGLHTWTPDAPGAVASLEVLRAVRLAIERLAAPQPPSVLALSGALGVTAVQGRQVHHPIDLREVPDVWCGGVAFRVHQHGFAQSASKKAEEAAEIVKTLLAL